MYRITCPSRASGGEPTPACSPPGAGPPPEWSPAGARVAPDNRPLSGGRVGRPWPLGKEQSRMSHGAARWWTAMSGPAAVTLMVPSPCALAKNQFTYQPGTQRPGDLLRGLRDLLQPRRQLAAVAHLRRAALHGHRVPLGGLEQHLRAVIERKPHELGHRTPPRPAPGPSVNCYAHPPAPAASATPHRQWMQLPGG